MKILGKEQIFQKAEQQKVTYGGLKSNKYSQDHQKKLNHEYI